MIVTSFPDALVSSCGSNAGSLCTKGCDSPIFGPDARISAAAIIDAALGRDDSGHPTQDCISRLRERIFIELMTSDHKLETSREGSK